MKDIISYKMKNIAPYKFIISQRSSSYYIICPKCGISIKKPTDKIVECPKCKNKIRIISREEMEKYESNR